MCDRWAEKWKPIITTVFKVLHHLSMVKASNLDSKMEAIQAKKEAESAKKTSIKIGPWDVCKSVFSAEEQKSMSLFDKSDLYFHDYNLAGLFVQQNYLSSKPVAAGGDRKKVSKNIRHFFCHMNCFQNNLLGDGVSESSSGLDRRGRPGGEGHQKRNELVSPSHSGGLLLSSSWRVHVWIPHWSD